MPLFVEYGELERFLIKVLTIIVTVESLVIMGLGFLAVKQRVVYVNPSNVIGTTHVGYVPDDSAAYFGMTFIFFLGNVNEYSAKEQYKSAYLLMSPKLQSVMKRTFEGEIAEIKNSDISVQTTPITYKVQGNGDEFTVIIEAIRKSYVYGQDAKKEKLQYTISCQKAHITKTNPFGLEVTSYENKVVAEGAAIAAGDRQQ